MEKYALKNSTVRICLTERAPLRSMAQVGRNIVPKPILKDTKSPVKKRKSLAWDSKVDFTSA
jgi:hypothetical protein